MILNPINCLIRFDSIIIAFISSADLNLKCFWKFLDSDWVYRFSEEKTTLLSLDVQANGYSDPRPVDSEPLLSKKRIATQMYVPSDLLRNVTDGDPDIFRTNAYAP